MVKKLFLSVFTVLIFTAFTGVPVLVHYCGMGSMSAKACNMCETVKVSEPQEESTDSCCEDEQQPEESPYSFTTNTSCCHSDILSAPIKIDSELTAQNLVKKVEVLTEIHFITIPTLGEIVNSPLSAELIDRAPPITQPPIRILTSSLLV